MKQPNYGSNVLYWPGVSPDPNTAYVQKHYVFSWSLPKEGLSRPVNSPWSSGYYSERDMPVRMWRSPSSDYAPLRESRHQVLINRCLVDLQLRYIDQLYKECLSKRTVLCFPFSVGCTDCFALQINGAPEHFDNSWIQSRKDSPLERRRA